MRPDATRYNPSPTYLRGLLKRAGVSQQAAARAIGLSPRTMRYYLTSLDAHGYRPAPYLVQYALEMLALSRQESQRERERRLSNTPSKRPVVPNQYMISHCAGLWYPTRARSLLAAKIAASIRFGRTSPDLFVGIRDDAGHVRTIAYRMECNRETHARTSGWADMPSSDG